MNNNFALYDTIREKVLSYPRGDDEPVIGLDPRYLVLRIVKEERPDALAGWRIHETRTVDLDALEWRHGWELIELPPPTGLGPDYVGFYTALLGSATYRAMLQAPATAELARALVVFVSAIQDAMNFRANPQALQGAISLLLGQIALTDEHLAELMELMSVYRLDTVYTLAPT
jgi:hypothetical protein